MFVRRSIDILLRTCVKKTVKYEGGSVMIRGVISVSGFGQLIRLQMTVNAGFYMKILSLHVLPHLRYPSVRFHIFVYDSTPCHTAKSEKSRWRLRIIEKRMEKYYSFSLQEIHSLSDSKGMCTEYKYYFSHFSLFSSVS